MMNSTSRFKEHFEIDPQQNNSIDQFYYSLNNTVNSIYSSSTTTSSSQYCKSPVIYLDQYDSLHHQSVSTTESTATSSTTGSSSSYSFHNNEGNTNSQCHLKRKARVKTRRPKAKTESFFSQASATSSIVNWCRKQKSKLFGVRQLA